MMQCCQTTEQKANVRPQCGVCGGPGVYLGTLGTRDHYRCRMCGLMWSEVAGEDDETEE